MMDSIPVDDIVKGRRTQITEYNRGFKVGQESGYHMGYADALQSCLVNTKELINELGEEQGLKALRDWLKHELKSMGDEE